MLAGVLALSPGARSAFLEIFRIRGATVERVETLPDVQAQRIDFGERLGRTEAERRAGFRLLDLGSKPDAIFVRPDGLASVVYGDPSRPRLVLSQARGAIYEGFIKKTGGRDTNISYVTVAGEPGLFVDGADHFVMFRDENGAISDERTYVAGTSCSGTGAHCCSGSKATSRKRRRSSWLNDRIGNRCALTGVSRT